MSEASARLLVYVLNSYSENEASHFHHVFGLLQALADGGIEVVLVIEKGSGKPTFRGNLIRVVRPRFRRAGMRHLSLVWLLWRNLRRGAVCFVRISLPGALCALLPALSNGARVYYWQSGTVHAHDRNQPFGVKKLRWWLSTSAPFWLVSRTVHRFVTGPESMIAYYRDVVGVSASRLALLYNDIDVERFAAARNKKMRAQSRVSVGIPAEALVMLFVHRLSPVRRSLMYMPCVVDEAIQDMSPVLRERLICVVAGGGPELPALRAEVERRGIGGRFVFLGEFPNRDIERLYACGDIFLHPTYNEGFPRVVLEAMAAGLPMVSTDAGGTTELVGPAQREYVVSRDDISAFSQCLKRLIESESERSRLSRENIESVRRFDTRPVAGMYERVLFP